MKRNSHNGFKRSTLFGICFAVFFIAFATVRTQAQQTTVSLKHPLLEEI